MQRATPRPARAPASRAPRHASYGRQSPAPAERAVYGEVVVRHARRGEALLEALADREPAEPRRALERADRSLDRIDDEAGAAVLDDFGHRAVRPGDHRRTAGHRLDHGEAEGLGPVDREE